MAGKATLTIFNMKGQEINVLAQGYHNVDSYSVVWNGTDMYGVEMPAGMYIYKLVADGFVQSNKMLFVK
jgi:flagellar hook assembly protein FlgD